jgi:hypothetical protein
MPLQLAATKVDGRLHRIRAKSEFAIFEFWLAQFGPEIIGEAKRLFGETDAVFVERIITVLIQVDSCGIFPIG